MCHLVQVTQPLWGGPFCLHPLWGEEASCAVAGPAFVLCLVWWCPLESLGSLAELRGPQWCAGGNGEEVPELDVPRAYCWVGTWSGLFEGMSGKLPFWKVHGLKSHKALLIGHIASVSLSVKWRKPTYTTWAQGLGPKRPSVNFPLCFLWPQSESLWAWILLEKANFYLLAFRSFLEFDLEQQVLENYFSLIVFLACLII